LANTAKVKVMPKQINHGNWEKVCCLGISQCIDVSENVIRSSHINDYLGSLGSIT
jgi:hypothetical protein